MGQAMEVVRCRRIELLDDDDVVRASLSCSPGSDDGVHFELFSPKRSRSIVLEADDQTLGLSLWHRGSCVASVGMDRHGIVRASGVRW